MSEVSDFHDELVAIVKHENAVNEDTLERWVLSGMVGKLVKRDGYITIEPCDPAQNGELVIYDYGRTDFSRTT